MPADGQVSVGSTFLPEAPDPPAWAPTLRRGGERFVPGLRRAKVVGARACARPQSFDGRPLVGEVPGQEGLWTAAGHGPWGISAGPGHGPDRRGRAARQGRGAGAAVGLALLAASASAAGSGRTITVSTTSLISSAREAGGLGVPADGSGLSAS